MEGGVFEKVSVKRKRRREEYREPLTKRGEMLRFNNTVGRLGWLKITGLRKVILFFLPSLIFGGLMVEKTFAMGTSGGGSQQGGGIAAFLPLIAIVVIFYFLLIRPQSKRQKEHKTMISTLRKGDKVITSSGMYGTIVGMDDKENKVVLKVAENVKIEFTKSSIAGRVGTEE
jgi:preprotein translocase subunit YajC